jgi:hypothetical protein
MPVGVPGDSADASFEEIPGFGGMAVFVQRLGGGEEGLEGIVGDQRHAVQQATAIERTVRVRQENYQDKLGRARQAIAEWEKQWKKGRTKDPWKKWVADRVPNITPKFLTRAVNAGELASPANLKEKEAHERRK